MSETDGLSKEYYYIVQESPGPFARGVRGAIVVVEVGVV